MSQFDSAEFKTLRRFYYDLLKKNGFKDIEDEKGNLTDHKTVHDLSQRVNFKSDIYDLVQDYHTWAYQHAHQTRFSSSIDRKIWLLHSEGKTSREIAAVVKLHQTWICKKIKQIRERLKTKKV